MNKNRSVVEIRETKDYIVATFEEKVYKIPKKYKEKAVLEIKREIENYKRRKYDLIREAAALGVIIIPTTVSGEDPYFFDLKKNIERILKKYSKTSYTSLESYMK